MFPFIIMVILLGSIIVGMAFLFLEILSRVIKYPTMIILAPIGGLINLFTQTHERNPYILIRKKSPIQRLFAR